MKEIIIALIPVVVAVFGSTGFWSYMQSKKDKTKDVLEAITGLKTDVCDVKREMDTLKANIEETEAKNCRNRIVRFADEIRLGEKSGNPKVKSKDAYDHCMGDIDFYQNFCKDNPNFMNGIAEVSIKKIKQHYEADDFM